jgi:putative flippase GtrA
LRKKYLNLKLNGLNLRSVDVRYILVGVFNTLVGYFAGVLIYKAFIGWLSILSIGFISNIISITVSFLTMKIIVFQKPGNWLKEYFKCYLIYGSMALVGISFLWVFLTVFHLNIWISQGLILALTGIISYVAHTKFTFR